VQTAKNYGQVYNELEDVLVTQFKKNNAGEISLEKNLPIHYQWRNPRFTKVHGLEHYTLESINYHQVANVISNVSDYRLKNMQNDEVLVNDKFAKYHHLKVGDRIDLHDFSSPQPHHLYKLRKSYKIIGFGTKMHNLFVNQDLFDNKMGDLTPNTAFFYLTEQEMQSY